MKIDGSNRKVLISIKLSTIVIAIIIIIAIALAGIKINQLILNKKNNLTQTSVNRMVENEQGQMVSLVDAEIVDTTEEVNQNQEINDTDNIKRELITSRSSAGREKIAVINNDEEVVEAQTEQVIAVTTSIDEVTISVDMDLTVRTGLSRNDFITLISGVSADTSGFFEENAGKIYDVCEKYSLNEIFFCGLISAESGWTIASNHRNTHNYISLMSGNGLIRFDSVDKGLEQAAKVLHEKYLTPGGAFYYGPTLAAMKTRFCPVSSTWVGLVYGRMDQIV